MWIIYFLATVQALVIENVTIGIGGGCQKLCDVILEQPFIRFASEEKKIVDFGARV